MTFFMQTATARQWRGQQTERPTCAHAVRPIMGQHEGKVEDKQGNPAS
jgi:hypothetical protein